METYREWRSSHGSGKPFKVPADIAERWQNRVIAQGLKGRMGGGVYLGRYGKGIGVGKLVKLALTAEQHVADWPGSDEMAQFFWEVAYEMAHGQAVPVADRYNVSCAPFAVTDAKPDPEAARRQLWTERGVPLERQEAILADVADKAAPGAMVGPFQIDGEAFAVFPAHLRPGAVVTMQPTDAKQTRGHYINDPRYCGQPKRDGIRMVVFAAPEAVAWQARSQQIKTSPAPEIDAVLRAVAAEYGPFILDGELWWPDANDGEHRTAAQAAAANVKIGAGNYQVYPVYSVFECLACAFPDLGFVGRSLHDLTGCAMQVRFDAARRICATLISRVPAQVEYLTPVFLASGKRDLANRQHSEGREGEVWRRADAPYTGGKQAGDGELIVRTKYLQTRDVVVTGFSATGATKLVRAFAAMQVSDPVTGEKLGNVGTGFTQTDQQTLVDGFAAAQAAGRPFLIEVESQGVTEGGILWHPRFVGIKTD